MRLDLKGLKIVWVGMLLSIVGSLCSSSGSRNAVQGVTDLTMSENTASTGVGAMGTIGGVLAIVAFILVIVGLSKLKYVSPYFKKARNLQIALLILAIVLVVVLAVVLVATIIGPLSGSASSDGAALGAPLIGAGVVLIVFVILMLIFGILYNTNLLKGCQQTAKLCEDANLSKQFWKMRKTYIIAIVLVVVGVIVIVCSVFVLGAATADLPAQPGNNIQPLIGIIPGAVLTAIGGIIMLIYTILLLVRMALLWKYDGKELPQETNQMQGM